MNVIATSDIERSIARCRLFLSVGALAAVFVDPTEPILTRWIPLTGGSFVIDPYALATLTVHLCYSLIMIAVVSRRSVSLARLATITTCGDVLFGAAIAAFTEGITSPFYAFFAFAVVETGLRAGFRATMLVTAASVGIYLSLIMISASGNANIYIMRPVYLAITGYLVGYLGQQRLNLEAGVREIAAASERQRIARDLHDGRAQDLAAIALRLETCQELLRRGRSTEALLDLSELQTSVNREYDEFRAYMRTLVGLDTAVVSRRSAAKPRVSIAADFEGPADLVEQVLHIVREGIANVLRHAHARKAAISVRASGPEVRITIDDDGVGFGNSEQQPWSISSRVAELGGMVRIAQEVRPGAHLAITLPVG